LASEPLLFIPNGMQVFGSKPWFCMKKMTRLGVEVLAVAESNCCGVSVEAPNAPAANVFYGRAY